jgi:hypothetical protein
VQDIIVYIVQSEKTQMYQISVIKDKR